MGIYKLSDEDEEIQETTMTDPLEQTISWEWFEKIKNIISGWRCVLETLLIIQSLV